MAVAIKDKNEFVLDAAKMAMHALLANSTAKTRDPRGIASEAGKYAVALWLAMRPEV
jgi:hypothetical protein